MILFYKRDSFEEECITTKKELYYSEEFTFIPIFYKKQPLLLQTPTIFIPYGIQKYSESNSKEYMNISFQDFSRNKVSKDFIQDFLKPIYQEIVSKYKHKYQFEPFLKESQYSQWMRCKLTESTQFFNQEKKPITSFSSKLFGSLIIQLTGLWIMDTKARFQWTVIQG